MIDIETRATVSAVVADLYHDYILITQMKASTPTRCILLSDLLSSSPGPWPVIGITKAALELFKKKRFKYVSRMGINRSHLVSRSKTYRHMIGNVYDDPRTWWEFYQESDKTVLATASENVSSTLSETIYFDGAEGLFRSSGYTWTHAKDEQAFLRKLYREETKKSEGL